jgi:hypothetical protein
VNVVASVLALAGMVGGIWFLVELAVRSVRAGFRRAAVAGINYEKNAAKVRRARMREAYILAQSRGGGSGHPDADADA